jgi:serine/threonine protein kinase/WD40 repeat protein
MGPLREAVFAAVLSGRRPDVELLLTTHPRATAGDVDAAFRSILAELSEVERVPDDDGAAPPDEGAPDAFDGGDDEPESIGGYRILFPIGRGGMATVYLALEGHPSREVALKVFDPAEWGDDPRRKLAVEDVARRFREEVQRAGNLKHEGIVAVYKAGEDRGRLYFAMPFIDGYDLHEIIEDLRKIRDPGRAEEGFEPFWIARRFAGYLGTPEPGGRAPFYRAVAEIGAQAARALHHAHTRDVVHRDVKPQNILVEEVDGRIRAWVTDFGLSSSTVGDPEPPDGTLIGTLPYMSHEQVVARLEVGRKSDVYSLAASLYELLTREPLIPAGERQEVLRRISLGEKRPPRSLDPMIPSTLEHILMTALEVDEQKRYDTAGDFADDLDRFVAGRPIRGKGLPRRKSYELYVRDRKLKLAFGALSVVLPVVAALVLFYFLLYLEKARTARQRDDALNARAAAEDELYGSRIAHAHDGWRSGRAEDYLAPLVDASPEAGEADRRGWEWYYLRSLERKGMTLFRAPGSKPAAAALSPDGTLVALSFGQEEFAQERDGRGELRWRPQSPGLIEIREVPSRRLVRTLTLASTGPAVALAWSRDEGKLAAVDHRGEATVWDVASSKSLLERETTPVEKPFRHASLAWSLWDRELIAVRGEQVTAWEVPSGRMVLSEKLEGGSMAGSNYSTPLVAELDGGTIVVAEGGMIDAIRLVDVRKRQTIVQVEVGQEGPSAAALSGDGTQLATSSGDEAPTISIRSVESGSLVRTLSGSPTRVRAAAFSPDGGRLAAGCSDGSVAIFDCATGAILQRMFAGFDGVGDIQWSRDGRRLLARTGNRAVWTWDLGEVRERYKMDCEEYYPDDPEDLLLRFSADSRLLNVLHSAKTPLVSYVMEGRELSTGSVVTSFPWTPSAGAPPLWEGDRLVGNVLPPFDPLAPRDPRKIFAARTSAASPSAVELYDIKGGAVRKSLPIVRGRHVPVAFSPDGRWLATRDETDGMIWDLRAGSLLLSVEGVWKHASELAWSSDGRYVAALAVSTHKRPTALIDLEKGGVCYPFRRWGSRVTAASFHPAGGRLAIGDEEGHVQILGVPGGTRMLTLRFASMRKVEAVGWSPDGRKLAARCGRKILVWDATEGYEAKGVGWDD